MRSSIKVSILSTLLVLILLLSSCSNAGIATATSIATVTSTDMPTLSSRDTPVPLGRETKLPAQPLPPTKIECVSSSQNAEKPGLQGVVAFKQPGNENSLNFGFYLVDLEDRHIVGTIEEGLSTQISPDRKHLAYRYRTPDRQYYLRVLDSSGKKISDLPLRIEGRGQSFFNWQNARQLRTLQQNKDWRLVVHLLDPFNQEYTMLRTDWDGAYAPEDPIYGKVPQWKFDQQATEIFFVYGANILYDPSLTRVVYPKDNSVVTLVDVQTEKELASAKFTDWGRLPSWSPSGEYLTILNREAKVNEFYLVSRNGDHFERITDFSKEWGNMSVFEYSWSPDSRQVAFWLNPDASEPKDGIQSELAILDIASRQVTRLCIQGISVGAAEPWMMGHPEPIWSPDSRYIMITQWDNPVSPRKYSVLVIDTVTGLTQKISENTAPIGWMVTP